MFKRNEYKQKAPIKGLSNNISFVRNENKLIEDTKKAPIKEPNEI